MNLMEEARKIGNETQGGWAAMPATKREDEKDTNDESPDEIEQQEEYDNSSDDELETPATPPPELEQNTSAEMHPVKLARNLLSVWPVLGRV